MSYAQPHWKLLLDCGRRLTAAGRTPFTRGMLIDCAQRVDPTAKEGSLNPTIQGMTDNLRGGNGSGLLHPSFHSVGRGEFVLLDSAMGSPIAEDDHRQALAAKWEERPLVDPAARLRSLAPAATSLDGFERRIGLIGCVKEKEKRAVPARSLYRSPLFHGRRAYVERTCSSWFILSAEHGLVHPDRMLEPYDVTLKDEEPSRRRVWSQQVLADLSDLLGDLTGAVFEIHAGAAYRDSGLVEGLEDRGAVVEVPAEGLGLGQQLHFYGEAAEAFAGDDEE
jgi:hypothetical protein